MNNYIVSWTTDKEWVLFPTADAEKKMAWNILKGDPMINELREIGDALMLIGENRSISVYSFDSSSPEEVLRQNFKNHFDAMIEKIVEVGIAIYIETEKR